MRHQWRVRCRLPVVASTDGEAGHVDASNSLDLNPIDYSVLEMLQENVYETAKQTDV